MKQLIYLSVIFAFSTLLTGCDQSVTNFVKGSRPSNIGSNLPPLVSNGPSQMKISPGRMSSNAAGATVIGNVTATNKFASSANASVRVAISRSRTSVQ